MRENVGKKRLLVNNCLKSSNNEPLCKRDRVYNSRPQKEEREKEREIDEIHDGREARRILERNQIKSERMRDESIDRVRES